MSHPRRFVNLVSVGALLALVACEPGSKTECPEPSTAAEAAGERAATGDLVAQADALAKRTQEIFEVPGMSVAVVVGDEVVLAKGYGVKELGKDEPIDAETSFAIASNTKAFTATALGLLVEEGKLSWDDPVVDHIPDFELWDPYVTRELRVRDLLSHRVGLDTWAGDLMWLSSNYDRDTIMKRLKHLPAGAGLRERYGYCNLMFMVAGILIEKHSGQDWDAFLRARILDPLGMKDVATRVGQLEGRPNVAKAHVKVDGKWETTPYLDLAAIGPAASFHANVVDMAKWARMQLDDGQFGGNEVVPKAVIRETRQPHIWLKVREKDVYEPHRNLSGYGLGWYLADYRGELMAWHGGGMPGMTSRVLLFPESDVAVVVLTSSESAASNTLAIQIADLFLTGPDEPRKDYLAEAQERVAAGGEEEPAPVLKGEPPAGITGKFKNPMLGTGVIAKGDDGTWFEVPDHGGLRCRLYGAAETAGQGDAKAPEQIPCAWTDPNMGVSQFRLEYRGKKVRSMAFKVRPDFYDPLEYTFAR